MIETLTLIAFVLAILFVAMLAPKPTGRDTKPSAKELPAKESSDNAPSGKGADVVGPENKDPDSPDE